MNWIKCSDRLPGNEYSVLIWHESQITFGAYSHDEGWISYDVEDGEIKYELEEPPTHWMPLPEPPKEEE